MADELKRIRRYGVQSKVYQAWNRVQLVGSQFANFAFNITQSSENEYLLNQYQLKSLKETQQKWDTECGKLRAMLFVKQAKKTKK